MTSNNKVIFLYLKPNYSIFVLILDLIVNLEINIRDANESSEATEVSEFER